MNKPAEDVMTSHYQSPPDSDYSPAENFESGDFSTLDWMTLGDEYWFITSDESYSGNYSVQAGSIGENESSSLEVTLHCTAGEIRFYHKVSSELDYDSLTFYIDGIEQDKWSGERDWTAVSFPLIEGRRTFTWTYTKDDSVSSGSDAAWIDDIVFPVNETTCPPARKDRRFPGLSGVGARINHKMQRAP